MQTPANAPALHALRLDARFHDVELICEGGVSVTANKAVLAATCPYFEHMFYGSLLEARASTVQLHEVHAEGLHIALDWLHGIQPQQIGANSATAAGYLLADKYGIAGLEQFILQRIEDLAPLPNVYLDELMTPALAWSLLPLLQAGVKAFHGDMMRCRPETQHLGTGALYSMFDGLSPPVVCHLLQHAPILMSEHKVLEHLVRWAQSASNPANDHTMVAEGFPPAARQLACSSPPSVLATAPCSSTSTSSSIDLLQLQAAAWDHVERPHAAASGEDIVDVESPSINPLSMLTQTAKRRCTARGVGTAHAASKQQRTPAATSHSFFATEPQLGVSALPFRFRDKLRTALPFVRLECVRPSVLASLIEPLGVLRPEQLLALYRAHALTLEGSRKAVSFGAPLRPCWAVEAPGFSCPECKPCRVECCREQHGGIRTLVPLAGPALRTWCIEVVEPCEFVWVGVTDGDTDMMEWLGKQAGGWMYGSNDALCHNTQQDNGPYTSTLGLRPWKRRVYCRWDPLAGTLHYGTDESLQTCGTSPSASCTTSSSGSHDLDSLPEAALLADVPAGPGAGATAPGRSEAGPGLDPGVVEGWRLGFKGLPSVVYPAVSLRKPGVVEMRLIE